MEAPRGDLVPALVRRWRPTATTSRSRATVRSSATRSCRAQRRRPRRTSNRYIKEWGRNANPRWSPDGSKLAFVSVRDNHSLHRRLRRAHAAPALRVAERRLRRQSDVVARRQTARVRQATRHAVRASGAGRRREPRKSRRSRAAGRGGRGARQRRPWRRGGAADGRADGLVSRGVHGRLYDFSHGRRHRGLSDARRRMRGARVLAQPAERQGLPERSTASRGRVDNVIFPQEPEEWIRWYSVAVDGGGDAGRADARRGRGGNDAAFRATARRSSTRRTSATSTATSMEGADGRRTRGPDHDRRSRSRCIPRRSRPESRSRC